MFEIMLNPFETDAPEEPLAPVIDARRARTTLRRHALGADNVRGLLMTVMGEFLLPSGGAAWTSVFIEVLSLLGTEPGTTRQALARTAAAGWLEAERVGGGTRWQLTPAGGA